MKVFEMRFDLNKKNCGIKAISMVESPAIGIDFITLSKETSELQLAINKEQRIVTGPVLIPDKKIYRTAQSLGTEEDGYIYFTKETIKKLSEQFLASEQTNQTTLDHEESTNDFKVVENWIIIDKEKDKAVALGFDLPVGTWMQTKKCMSIDAWEAVKSGKYKGFSIEASGLDKVEYALSEQIKPLELAEPGPTESKDEFLPRCIKFVMDNGEATSNEQAYAICISKWENKLSEEINEEDMYDMVINYLKNKY